jgi:hypothetical protein
MSLRLSTWGNKARMGLHVCVVIEATEGKGEWGGDQP